MKPVKSNRLWGIIIFCLGAFGAELIWKPAFNQGKFVRLFALLIAITLAGLLMLATNKSFLQLAESWEKYQGLLKLQLLWFCVSFYIWAS